MTPPPCLTPHREGTLLKVSVAPNAKRTSVDGLHDGALRIRLAAPPIDGRANEALVAWLAKALGCPRRDVSLLRGESSRRKDLVLALPPARVAQWLEDLRVWPSA